VSLCFAYSYSLFILVLLKMSEANILSEVSPTLSQPHSNPALTAIGRIKPTPSNPKGYPPYELTKVPNYTNS
jgi:hypothetical protein